LFFASLFVWRRRRGRQASARAPARLSVYPDLMTQKNEKPDETPHTTHVVVQLVVGANDEEARRMAMKSNQVSTF
jgi:hypothetical protein